MEVEDSHINDETYFTLLTGDYGWWSGKLEDFQDRKDLINR